MKKKLVLLAAFGLCISVAGCSNNNYNDTPETTEAITTNSIPETTTEEVTTEEATTKKHDYMEWKFSWTLDCVDRRYSMKLTLDKEMYKEYHSRKRVSLIDSNYFSDYLLDKENLEIAKRIAKLFLQIKEENNLSTLQIVNEIGHFSHQLCIYEYDKDYAGVIEYPKYLIETIMDRRGDCEDTTIFIASIIKEMGFDTIFLLFDDHIMVGVAGGEGVSGTHYKVGDKKYFCLETTANGYTIGVLPNGYENKKAKVIYLKDK